MRENRAVSVEAIHFSADDPRWERVCCVLSEHEVPVVEVVEGENPRLFMDFLGVEAWKGPSAQQVKGRWIKRIRSHLHRDANRLRIVLDVLPGADLFVHRYYFNSVRIFCLWVRDRPFEPAASDDLVFRQSKVSDSR